MSLESRGRCLVAVAALAATSFLATEAEAGTITLVRDKVGTSDGTNDYSGNNGGGEFGVSAFSGADIIDLGSNVKVSGSSFQTFCLEKAEVAKLGTGYEFGISTAANSGGGGAENGLDPISDQTAYLFTQFWLGKLSNYDFDPADGDRAESAAELQNAIWYLEGELSGLVSGSQALAWVQEAQAAVDDGSWSGLGNVVVLNLTTSTGAAAQDQLFYYMVPLPPAAYMGLGGLLGLGLIRAARRRRQQG